MAVIIGSQAIAELYHQKQKVDDADPGKESSRCEIGGSGEEELLEDMISFEDNFTHEQLKYLDIYLDGRKSPQAKKMVLSCSNPYWLQPSIRLSVRQR